MYLRSRSRALTLLATAMIIAGLAFYWSTARATKHSATWPAFTMTFKVWATDIGPKLTPGYAVYRLDFNEISDWRLELLEDPGNKNAEGTWTAYDGKTLRSYDATFDQSSQAPAPAEGHYVPTDWLMPGKIEHLKRHPGWKQSADQQGNTVLTHIEVLSDDQGEKRTVETEITAQPATGIPVRVIDRLNGQITREITVQNLSLK